MHLPDIWQVIGTPQTAEITAVVSTTISVVLARRGKDPLESPLKNMANGMKWHSSSFKTIDIG